MKKQYTVKQLEKLMEQDLLKCSNDFERSMCRAFCMKEIRERKAQG